MMRRREFLSATFATGVATLAESKASAFHLHVGHNRLIPESKFCWANP